MDIGILFESTKAMDVENDTPINLASLGALYDKFVKYAKRYNMLDTSLNLSTEWFSWASKKDEP